MITAKEIDVSGYKAIELTSDASDNSTAIREMDKWCRYHNCGRSGMRSLTVSRRDGVEYYSGLAYPAESTVAQGKAIYQSKIASKIGEGDIGKIVAIDVDSGEYAIASDEMKAYDDIEQGHINPRVYVMRIGYAAVDGVGSIVPRSPHQ